MKRTLSPLLSFGFSLLLLGACAPQAPSKTDTGSDLALLSNGPDLPEECNVCWDGFQECFAQGGDLEECASGIVECVDSCGAPPPPPECLHCAAGFEACVSTAQANGDSGEDCAIGIEGCLSSCESVDPCEQNPGQCEPPIDPNNCAVCHDVLEDCLDINGDANGEGCEQVMEDCLQTCEPGVGPTPDESQCQTVYEQCIFNPDGECHVDGFELGCEDALQLCQGQGNPGDDCSVCLDNLNDCTSQGLPGFDCPDLQELCADVCF